ncbi:hypothetical protein C8R45DRAFT_918188 [Mycena sanguinolenta]|nr:hypothetical protein C8R45DRAFT_918188 [Mycena sanguinolenta]
MTQINHRIPRWPPLKFELYPPRLVLGTLTVLDHPRQLCPPHCTVCCNSAFNGRHAQFVPLPSSRSQPPHATVATYIISNFYDSRSAVLGVVSMALGLQGDIGISYKARAAARTAVTAPPPRRTLAVRAPPLSRLSMHVGCVRGSISMHPYSTLRIKNQLSHTENYCKIGLLSARPATHGPGSPASAKHREHIQCIGNLNTAFQAYKCCPARERPETCMGPRLRHRHRRWLPMRYGASLWFKVGR